MGMPAITRVPRLLTTENEPRRARRRRRALLLQGSAGFGSVRPSDLGAVLSARATEDLNVSLSHASEASPKFLGFNTIVLLLLFDN